MARIQLQWRKAFTRCAVGALVVLLLTGELARQGCLGLKSLAASTTSRSPIEEEQGEKAPAESLAATAIQRNRHRANDRTTEAHCPFACSALVHHCQFSSIPVLDPVHRAAFSDRALPLRC